MNQHLRKKMVRYGGDDDCPICLSKLQSSTKFITRLPCFHLFHPDCINKWIPDTCPICRQVFYFTHYHYIVDTNGEKILYINNFLPSVYNLVMWELRRYSLKREWYSKKRALEKAKRYVTVRDYSTFFIRYNSSVFNNLVRLQKYQI